MQDLHRKKANMKKAALIFLGLATVMGGCSSGGNNHSISGLTPNQANKMSSSHAQITEAKIPQVNNDTRLAAGQLAEAQGNYSAAIAQYQAVLENDPKNLSAQFRLGVIYTQLKHFDDAVTIWQTYLKTSGNCAIGYSNLGFCYELWGKSDKAENAYKAGLAREPDNTVCKNNYALFLARQDRIEEAAKVWRTFLSEAEVHYNIASVYQMTGRRPLARDEYHEALRLNPYLKDAETRLAELQD
jgi:Flp pilus assembly protein TadD